MSKRGGEKPDSLELMLDTICDTFGSVLFIAILVVMLLQQTGGDVTPPPSIAVPPEQVHDLSQKVTELTAELVRLKANRESQVAIIESFAPEEVRELIQRRRELAAQDTDLQVKASELLVQNAELAARVEADRAENAKVQQDLDAALREKQQTRTTLENDRKSRTTEARLPVLRPPGARQEIGLVIRYGRLYLWHRYDQFHNRQGLNTDDFVIVGEEDGGLLTLPKPTGGILLDGSAESKDAVRRLLRRFDSRICYFSPIVRPDSFAAFAHFRDIALELGFNYRLMPVEANSPVYDRGGSATGVQ
jgi:low affinity Fe/Cu permease